MKPIVPRKEWRASHKVRLGMVVVGLAILVGFGFMVAAMGVENDSRLPRGVFFLPMPGFALLCLSLLYRGSVVVDERGIFYNRGGITSFISWELAKTAPVKLKSEMIVMSTLDLTVNRTTCIALNRIMGLGFPVDDIALEIGRGAS